MNPKDIILNVARSVAIETVKQAVTAPAVTTPEVAQRKTAEIASTIANAVVAHPAVKDALVPPPKPALASRTIIANIVTLVLVLGSFFGVDTGAIDQGSIVNAIMVIATAVSLLASSWFRVIARSPLSLWGK